MGIPFPPHVEAWLAARGISAAKALAAGVFWDGSRIAITVARPDGTTFCKRRRDPAKDKNTRIPKYVADTGGGRTLYRAETMAGKDIVIVCEGELDAVRLGIAWTGVATVSSTAGASNWDEAWGRLFADKFVVVWYDADKAGAAGARTVAKNVADWADAVFVVEHDPDAGKDVTEVLARLGRVRLADVLGCRGPFFATQVPPRLPESRRDERRDDGPKPPIMALMEVRYGVKFRRAGREYLCCCPIHHEKHPSMSVNAEKGLWHCHAGCGGGDAYGLVMKMENVDFKEAKKIIEEMNLIPL